MDDIGLTRNDEQIIQDLKHHLDVTFNIEDLGKLKYFLGIEVSYLPEEIGLSQTNFTRELLESFEIGNVKPTVTPLPINLKLSAKVGDFYHDLKY